ncbi:uncharacterized protein BP5553_03080 [Venustampulla echinocandica]|uniref:Uncharacterized protein n=1 Tax=Venustampulla echinocandica TaxID=2656787 RepID=A0A370TT78_9HELO|nr:uncharacterized protein BP5553_03080 [Venustampulla echinocandica]RDL38740.1 hypothetical protein BP5553_03080 [Venustampulla echinocandica]
MPEPPSKLYVQGGPPSKVVVPVGNEAMEGGSSDTPPKPLPKIAALGQVEAFTLVVLSEDDTRRVVKATPSKCLSEKRNPNNARSYQLDLLLKEFETAINDSQSENNRLYLKHGHLGYSIRDTFKVIRRQEHLEIALNYLFSNRGSKYTLDFEFHPETAKERGVRENVEKATQRTRVYKLKEAARRTAMPSGAVASIQQSPDTKPLPQPTAKTTKSGASTRYTAHANGLRSVRREPAPTPKDKNEVFQVATPSQPPTSAPAKDPRRHGPRTKTLTSRVRPIPQGKPSHGSSRVSMRNRSPSLKSPASLRRAWKRLFRRSFSFGKRSSGLRGSDKYQEQDVRFKSLYTEAGIETFVRGLNGDEESIPTLRETDTDVSEDPLDVEEEAWGDWSRFEYLMRQLHALQNSEELSQMTVAGQANLSRWQECCRMFQINPDNVGVDERVKITGLKSQLYQYQAFAIYWQMTTSRKVGGGFVGDEMGLGKTLTFLAYIVVERQLAWLWHDVAKSRESRDGKHLFLDQQGLDQVACPSNSERPNWIACPCVASNPTSQMTAKHGVRLACVPPPLVPVWMSQWKVHVDEKETALGMSLAVAHPPSFAVGSLHDNDDARRSRNVTLLGAAKVKMQAEGGILKDSPKPNQERLLLLTTAEVYKSWVRKVFEYETTALSTDKSSKTHHAKVKNRGIVFGIAMIDECHEEYRRNKGRSSVLADLPSAESPFLWGYSGTPLLNSPRGLEGVPWAIESQTPKCVDSKSMTKTGWEQDPEMEKFSNKALDYLCTKFETHIKETHGSKKRSQKFPGHIMPFLTTFMIRRTAESSWFGHPLVRLKPHYHHDVKLKHMDRYREEFNKFISILWVEMDTKLKDMQAKWDAKWGSTHELRDRLHTTRPTDVSLGSRCCVGWKLHIFLTFPYLVNLALLPPDDWSYLDFSAKECSKWASPSSEKRSPYCKRLRSIVESSPKCLWLYVFIRKLMQTRDVSGQEQKLVILTRFNAVALVVKLFIERYIPSTAKRVGLVITGTHPRLRAAALESFTDALQPNGQRKQKDNIQFLVGTTSLIGKGLDLTRAANVVLMEPDFEFRREMQAYARIHRIGQKNEKTNSWRLIVDNKYLEDYEYHNPEWKIVRRQWERRDLVGRKVEGYFGIDNIGQSTPIEREGKGKGAEIQSVGEKPVGPLGETLSELCYSPDEYGSDGSDGSDGNESQSGSVKVGGRFFTLAS